MQLCTFMSAAPAFVAGAHRRCLTYRVRYRSYEVLEDRPRNEAGPGMCISGCSLLCILCSCVPKCVVVCLCFHACSLQHFQLIFIHVVLHILLPAKSLCVMLLSQHTLSDVSLLNTGRCKQHSSCNRLRIFSMLCACILHNMQSNSYLSSALLSLEDLKVFGCQPSSDPTVL